MSGGACVIIIDGGEKLKALSQQVINLYTLEMQRMLTVPEQYRSALETALEDAAKLVRAALDDAQAHVGPPHDDIQGTLQRLAEDFRRAAKK